MQAVGGDFEPNAEVDELRWLPVRRGRGPVLARARTAPSLADLARTDVPRDAHAGPRPARPGRDRVGLGRARRPAAAGRARAGAGPAAGRVLPAFGPGRCCPPPPVRCLQTIEPLAERAGARRSVRRPRSGEEGFGADPEAGLALVERLLAPPERPGVTVVCSQGGAIPSVLHGPRRACAATPGLSRRRAKGSVWVLGGRAGALSRTTTATSTPTRTRRRG